MIRLRRAFFTLTLLASMLLVFGCDSQTSAPQAPPAAGEAGQAQAEGGGGQADITGAPADGAQGPAEAANPSQEPEPDQAVAFDLSGASAGSSDLPELKILQFLPNGQVPKLSQIAVMFNQPMVALGDFDLVDQDQMDLEPPIEGRLRWLNQYTLAFIPEEIYSGSLTLTATLKGGLKSLSGQELEKGGSVTVILPAVTARPDYYQLTFNPDSPFKPVHKVVFSQPVNLERLNSLAFFEGDEANSGEFSVPAIFTEAPSQYEPSEFRATAEPAENLPRNSSYRLVIKPGQFSKLGPRPTNETITILTGRTYGNLEASVKSRELDENNQAAPFGGLDFGFTVPVEFGAALAAISSDPPMAEIEELKKAYQAFLAAEKAAPDGAVPNSDAVQKIDPTVSSWAAQHNFKVLQTSIPLYPRLLPNTLYTITVKAGLKDALGQALPGDAVYRIRTGAYKPFVEIDESFGGIMEIATDPRVPVNLVNLPQVNIQGWALEPADAVRMLYLTDRNYLNRMYLGNQDKQVLSQIFNAFGSFARPKNLTLNTRRSLSELPYTELFSLEDLFGPDRIGKVLFVRLLESEYPTISIFQCTDLGLTVKVGRESSLAWVTDMPTGQSLSGAKVEILSRTGESLATGQTGPDGLVKLPGGLEINAILEKMEANPVTELGQFEGSQLFYIVASFENEKVLWSSQADDAFSLYRYNLEGGSAHPLGPNPDMAFLLSSQPIYKPGSLVRLKLIYREMAGENLKDLPAGPVKVIIHDPFAKTIFEERLSAGPFGTVSLDYQLPPSGSLGSHFVYLSKDPEATIPAGETAWSHAEFASIGSFEVQSFRSPPFDIEIEEMPKELISGETLSVKAKAAYHFGAPVSGQSAGWAVQDDTAYDFELPALPGFSVLNSFDFIPKDSDADESYSPPSNVLSQGNLILDNLGRLDFSLLVEPEAKPRPRRLSVNLSATDVDGRPVSKGAGLIAHPAELYPALKLRNYLAKTGEPQTFDLAAAAPDGSLSQAEVALTLYKRSWATSRRRNYSVSYIYDSKAYDEVIEEKTVKTG
ncbi:MAG: hypothetical protein LBE49_09280, partial [Deltaproteobacteria bacterium]|nr:hypothetical protein [Deltaproteobacteria bacterium]